MKTSSRSTFTDSTNSFPIRTWAGMPVAISDGLSRAPKTRTRCNMAEMHPQHLLTRHAQSRMGSRHISEDAVQATLDYGRSYRAGGAQLFRLGWREIASARQAGLDLSLHEGVHVILGDNGRVVTTWRCRTLRRLWR